MTNPSAHLAAIKARSSERAIDHAAHAAFPRFDSDLDNRIAFRMGTEYARTDVPLLADALQAVLDLATVEPELMDAGYAVESRLIIRTITTALAKGETS